MSTKQQGQTGVMSHAQQVKLLRQLAATHGGETTLNSLIAALNPPKARLTVKLTLAERGAAMLTVKNIGKGDMAVAEGFTLFGNDDKREFALTLKSGEEFTFTAERMYGLVTLVRKGKKVAEITSSAKPDIKVCAVWNPQGGANIHFKNDGGQHRADVQYMVKATVAELAAGYITVDAGQTFVVPIAAENIPSNCRFSVWMTGITTSGVSLPYRLMVLGAQWEADGNLAVTIKNTGGAMESEVLYPAFVDNTPIVSHNVQLGAGEVMTYLVPAGRVKPGETVKISAAGKEPLTLTAPELPVVVTEELPAPVEPEPAAFEQSRPVLTFANPRWEGDAVLVEVTAPEGTKLMVLYLEGAEVGRISSSEVTTLELFRMVVGEEIHITSFDGWLLFSFEVPMPNSKGEPAGD